MIYDSLKEIVDNNIANLSNYFTEIKTDNSLVTSVDLSIEKEISTNQILGVARFRPAPYLGWLKLIIYEPLRSPSERGFCSEN